MLIASSCGQRCTRWLCQSITEAVIKPMKSCCPPRIPQASTIWTAAMQAMALSTMHTCLGHVRTGTLPSSHALCIHRRAHRHASNALASAGADGGCMRGGPRDFLGFVRALLVSHRAHCLHSLLDADALSMEDVQCCLFNVSITMTTWIRYVDASG